MADQETTSGFAELRERVDHLEAGLGRVQLKLDQNTQITRDLSIKLDDNNKDTKTILNKFAGAEGGLKVLEKLGAFGAWLVATALALGALWVSLKGGK